MSDERKAFEAWMRAFFPSTDLSRGEDGKYLNEDTEIRWQKKRSHDVPVESAGEVKR